MLILRLRTVLSETSGGISSLHRPFLAISSLLAIAAGLAMYWCLTDLAAQPPLAGFMAICMSFVLGASCLLLASLDVAVTLQRQTQAENAYLLGRQGRLFDQANYDGLTGLPNRRLIEDRCRFAVQRARRNKRSFAFFTVSLPEFEGNELEGTTVDHDRQLLAMSERLTNAVRKSDTVVRMGKGQFVLIVESIQNPIELLSVSEKLLVAIGAVGPAIYGEGNQLGLALYPNDGENSDTLAAVAERTICHRRTLKDMLSNKTPFEWGEFWATNNNW